MENRIIVLKNLFRHKFENKYHPLYVDLFNWWWNFDKDFWTKICRRIKT